MRSHTVAQCRDVSLHAAYLAEEKAGEGAGFLLSIRNDRASAIEVADPMPLGVDWYAGNGSSWQWRASSGYGGSLLNALDPKGRMFVYSSATGVSYRTIAPHAEYSWPVFSKSSPNVLYRPGCQHCGYQGEEQFRAVLSYAFTVGAAAHPPDLLNCGLRSGPVVMPRLMNSPHR
ncbi:hypothetical protein D1Y84_04935 [Acidipila sp. EB88]|nr:hypothetical protein D1Y84_04935 [Acidipila sp. EB88]